MGKCRLKSSTYADKVSLMAHFLCCQWNTFAWHFKIKNNNEKGKMAQQLGKEILQARQSDSQANSSKINLGKNKVKDFIISMEKWHHGRKIKITHQKYCMAPTFSEVHPLKALTSVQLLFSIKWLQTASHLDTSVYPVYSHSVYYSTCKSYNKNVEFILNLRI